MAQVRTPLVRQVSCMASADHALVWYEYPSWPLMGQHLSEIEVKQLGPQSCSRFCLSLEWSAFFFNSRTSCPEMERKTQSTWHHHMPDNTFRLPPARIRCLWIKKKKPSGASWSQREMPSGFSALKLYAAPQSSQYLQFLVSASSTTFLPVQSVHR